MEPNETSAGAPNEQNDATMQNDSNMTAETPSVDVAVGAEAIVASEEIAESAKMPKDDVGGGMMASGAEPKKNGKGMVIGMILFALLAVGGIGFGVWAMMDGNNQKSQVEKQLNAQIDSLKQQNDELTEKLSEENKKDDVIVNIDTDGNTNPVIESGSSDLSYMVAFNSTNIGFDTVRSLHIDVKDGAVESCEVSYSNANEGGLVDVCEIAGLNGKIYKVIEFGRGQDKGMNKIGFIMEDGSVQYLSLSDAIEGKNYAIQGSLKIDGFVRDAVRIQVADLEHGVGGYFSTMFVLGDGSMVELNDSMMN